MRCMLSRGAALLGREGVKGFSANPSPQEGHKEGSTRDVTIYLSSLVEPWGGGFWRLRLPSFSHPNMKTPEKIRGTSAEG